MINTRLPPGAAVWKMRLRTTALSAAYTVPEQAVHVSFGGPTGLNLGGARGGGAAAPNPKFSMPVLTELTDELVRVTDERPEFSFSPTGTPTATGGAASLQPRHRPLAKAHFTLQLLHLADMEEPASLGAAQRAFAVVVAIRCQNCLQRGHL